MGGSARSGRCSARIDPCRPLPRWELQLPSAIRQCTLPVLQRVELASRGTFRSDRGRRQFAYVMCESVHKLCMSAWGHFAAAVFAMLGASTVLLHHHRSILAMFPEVNSFQATNIIICTRQMSLDRSAYCNIPQRLVPGGPCNAQLAPSSC